jgi:hypothetical protein
MDPVVIASIITAAGGLASKMLEFWKHAPEDKDVEALAANIVATHYEGLKDGVTNESMTIIRCLENGEQWRPIQLWRKVFDAAPEEPRALHEFDYRLKYLETIGLIREGLNSYRITSLGKAFSNEARLRKEYEGAG